MAQQSLCKRLPHPPSTMAVRDESKELRTKHIAVSTMHDCNASSFQAMNVAAFQASASPGRYADIFTSHLAFASQ